MAGAAADIRKALNLYVDGRGYAGQVEEFNPPKLTLKTEEFRAGGMDAPVEITMGMEKLTADFTMKSYDKNLLSQFGLAEGATVSITVKEALESLDGTVTAVTHAMTAKFTEIDPGTSKSGEATSCKFTVSLQYYKMTHGSTVVHEIDVINMVRTINGVDALASIRSAIGL